LVLDEVNGIPHTLVALPLLKNAGTPKQEADWAPELLWKLGEEKELFLLLAFEPWTIQPVA
jgi:hypothetical protein